MGAMRSGSGISISGGCMECGNIIIMNNVIRNMYGPGTMMNPASGIEIGSAVTNTKIYNNSINLYGNTLNGFNAISAGIYLFNSAPEIYNNCIVSTLGIKTDGTGDGAAGVYFQGSFDSLINMNNNSYYVASTGTGRNSVAAINNWTEQFYYQDLRTWVQAYGRDRNSVEGNPYYISNDNLLPDTANSNCWLLYRKAMPGTIVPIDIRGLARSTTLAAGPACIGAYEFQTNTAPP